MRTPSPPCDEKYSESCRAQRLLVLPLGARCVPVQSRDARARKLFAQSFLEVLRAFAKKINVLRLALRTNLGNLLDRTTVMAFEAIPLLVMRHRDAAVHALHRRATAPAQHRPGIPAPVDQHQRLRAIRQAFLNSRVQRRRNRAGLARLLT